jgi:HlyD family secretion protein
VIAWGIFRKADPPRVNFVRVKRQTLISTLATNGKAEPLEWETVHSETGGIAGNLRVHEGESVARGAELLSLSDPALIADIESADAKLAEARASLQAVQAGAKPADLAAIDASLARARLEHQQATSDYEALHRLAEKQAATAAEVKAAHDKMNQFELEVEGLEKRRGPLVSVPDQTAAQARIRDAEAVLKLARQRASRTVVRAPMAGVIYNLAIRAGSFVHAGDPLMNIGRLDRLRVRVYVDEPELGRMMVGQPVTIRWQALPGKEWQGAVERRPVSVQALGSRQVGEVVCSIENPGRELIPGTNVDAEIRTAVAENALVIPREALRHDTGGDFVYALQGDAIERRPVKSGAASIALVEIASGLAENDAVALPSSIPLQSGALVAPVIQ